ncbi:hypothetical protein GCM10009661_84040 [Catellatospora chokoriensis]|uniref:Uncharacterized protein n=1 Tax=Catellatospora chokoriensis TaxID=310353 RepID=A0A8J3KCN4_9ACTN|nr:hypothetical protein Cch02nite_82140 [Catellatospora chokoriensis]
MPDKLARGDKALIVQLCFVSATRFFFSSIGIFCDALLSVGDHQGDYTPKTPRNHKRDTYQIEAVLRLPCLHVCKIGPIEAHPQGERRDSEDGDATHNYTG